MFPVMQNEDSAAFLEAMKDVSPLKAADNKITHLSPKTPNDAQRARRQAAETDLEEDINYLASEHVELVDPKDQLAYKRDGVQEGVFKNLRLGKYELDTSINLQGKRLMEARQELFKGIRDCHQRGLRTLLLQHGMGLNSKPHPALLKSYVNKWLTQMPEVLAFHSALKHQGGYGACYVLLRKNQEQKLDNRERHAKR